MKMTRFIYSLCCIMSMNTSYALPPSQPLIYCSEGSPPGFDVSQTRSLIQLTSVETLYNRLVEFERGSTHIQPGLAERWDISKDGKVYTFHLRHGVKFHTTPWFKPTRDFNAEDVLFTFNRMRDSKQAFRLAYPVEFPFWHQSGFDQILAKIEAPNLYQVVFTLKVPNAAFLANLALPDMGILSEEYARTLLGAGKPSEINWKPIGTGPFIFEKYIKDQTIYFKGNPEYWKPDDVRLSRLIFDITPDAKVRAQKLKMNECQVSGILRSVDIAAFETDPNFQVLSQRGLNLAYLAYNVTHKPLDDVRVRRALDMAINKQAIIKVVYKGRAQAAVAPLPPLVLSYDQNLKDAPRNFEQAKALLAQAGYPKGLTISLFFAPEDRPHNPNPRLMAEMIQADWQQIGVKAKLVASGDFAQYLKAGRDGTHDAMLVGWYGSSDPDEWFKLLSCSTVNSGGNFTKWCDPPFEDLIQRAVQTTDIASRTALYRQAQHIFKREQPFTPICYATVYQTIRKHVDNFKINPLGWTVFYGVGLK